MERSYDARDGIRTQELLRDQPLKLAPLTWLGNPRRLAYLRLFFNFYTWKRAYFGLQALNLAPLTWLGNPRTCHITDDVVVK
jgi:hypothetical protein